MKMSEMLTLVDATAAKLYLDDWISGENVMLSMRL